jgi:cytochrome c oxidase subunit 1
VPTVHALDEFWHRKYVEDQEGRLVRVPAGASGGEHAAEGGHGIHLPSPSFWPLVVSIGFPIMGYGVLYSWGLLAAGLVITVVGLIGWTLEPSVAE